MMLFSAVRTPFWVLVTSIFISMTLDGVTSFSRIKNVRNTCITCITVKIVDGISLCNGGKLAESERSNSFFHRFFVC